MVVIAYRMSDNDCEEGRLTAPKKPGESDHVPRVRRARGVGPGESAKPVPKDGQVLVRVRAAALNPYDMQFLHGTPYLMRLSTGLRRSKFTGIGVDFSGVVESVGKNVTGFKPGDAVFGGCQGTLAEYLVIPSSSS